MVIYTGFKETKNIQDFKPILGQLSEVFGYGFLHTMLCWCGLIEYKNDNFWKVWLVTADASDENSEVIGICGLYSLNDATDELWLGWLGLISDWRNCGVGNTIISFLEREAIDVGCKKLMSYVDKNGKPLNFYYRAGFKNIGKVRDFLSSVDTSNIDMNEFDDIDDFLIEKELVK